MRKLKFELNTIVKYKKASTFKGKKMFERLQAIR